MCTHRQNIKAKDCVMCVVGKWSEYFTTGLDTSALQTLDIYTSIQSDLQYRFFRSANNLKGFVRAFALSLCSSHSYKTGMHTADIATDNIH